MKWVQQWLFQVEAYLETQHFDLDNDQIHFVQTLFKKHRLVDETPNLLEVFTWEEFKPHLNKRFASHHLVLKDRMEFLELTQGDGAWSLAYYV